MRQLKNYCLREWLRIKPVDHFLIEVCNDALQGVFCKVKPRRLKRFLLDIEHMRGEDIGLVIAYEQPWAVEWLVRMAARNFENAHLLIFDNSKSVRARREIERVCGENGTPYLPLPPNPTRHPNRSHGMAMTWVFYNVVLALKPRVFAYLDHDLIPMEKIEFSRILGDQPLYGALNAGGWNTWSLWAGCCLYSFLETGGLPLNFLNDFSNELDTGGRNWPWLYRNYDPERLRFALSELRQIRDPLDGSIRTVSIVDRKWLHIGAIGYCEDYKKNLAFYQRIAQWGYEGATLSDMAVEHDFS